MQVSERGCVHVSPGTQAICTSLIFSISFWCLDFSRADIQWLFDPGNENTAVRSTQISWPWPASRVFHGGCSYCLRSSVSDLENAITTSSAPADRGERTAAGSGPEGAVLHHLLRCRHRRSAGHPTPAWSASGPGEGSAPHHSLALGPHPAHHRVGVEGRRPLPGEECEFPADCAHGGR